MKKDFNDCFDLIKSEKIREFVKKALSQAPEQFWTAPCSSSGKYHPPEDQVEGGAIVHSRKAVQVALSLFRFFNIENQLVKDKIIAAVILHDIQKNGIPWGEKTIYEHGLIAARWLMSITESNLGKEELRDLMDIIELVKDHMGRWSQPYPAPALEIKGTTEIITEKNIWHLIIQLADYWGSRKWCPFVCDEFSTD